MKELFLIFVFAVTPTFLVYWIINPRINNTTEERFRSWAKRLIYGIEKYPEFDVEPGQKWIIKPDKEDPFYPKQYYGRQWGQGATLSRAD